MQVCEFCGTENTDLVNHCTACNEPLSAEAARLDVKKTEVEHHKQAVRKELLWGALAVILVGALGVAGFRSYRRSQLKDEVNTFYRSFVGPNEDMQKFWKCVTRSDKLPKDNIELESALEAAVVKSKGAYAKFVRDKCIPLVKALPGRLEQLPPPSYLAEPYTGYINALRALEKDTAAYAGLIDALDQVVVRDQKLQQVAANYHFAGQESADTYAYDLFMRCAIPGFDGFTEEQQSLDYLATAMKDPVPAARKWRNDCFSIIEKTEGTKPHADYKKKVEAFSSDDRDVQAFQDVLKAANDKERKQAHQPFEKAWYTFQQASEALVSEFGKYLGE